MVKFYNAQTSDKAMYDKVEKATGELWEAELKLARDNPKQSLLLSQGYQGDPTTEVSRKDFTALGEYSTSIVSTVYNQVMSMPESYDPILSRVRGQFENAQESYFPVRDAQAGIAAGGTFGSPVNSVETSGRSYMKASTGFFGSKVSLSIDELALFRKTGKMDGTYASEAMRRAISKCVIQMYQRQRLVVARSIAENEYTYYQDDAASQAVTLQFGRLAANNYTFATPWQTISTGTGVVTDNLAANPVNDLIDLFTNPQNTIVRNTLPFLKGLAMNPETARVLTKTAQNNKSPLDAIAYMAAKNGGGYDAEAIIKSNVPALKNVDIIIYEGMVNNSVDASNGTIDSKEYIIPTGIIIPIIDYENVGMGTMLFHPEPRAAWMSNAAPLPTGTLEISNPQSAYMRIGSSLQDVRAETPYWYCEAGARYAFVHPIAASASYIICTSEAVA